MAYRIHRTDGERGKTHLLRVASLLAKSLCLAACLASQAEQTERAADFPQQIDQSLIVELAFHENQASPEMRDGRMQLDPEVVVQLLPEVARVVVWPSQGVDLPETISAQFAKIGNEQPSGVLTVAMTHLGEGQYGVADASRDAMASWAVEHIEDFMTGKTALLRVDGLPEGEGEEGMDAWFEIEGECHVCANATIR